MLNGAMRSTTGQPSRPDTGATVRASQAALAMNLPEDGRARLADSSSALVCVPVVVSLDLDPQQLPAGDEAWVVPSGAQRRL